MTELWKENFRGSICIALGFFECVHFGHRHIIRELKAAANKQNAVPVLSTFSNNIFESFSEHTKLIFTYEERLQILESVGIDRVLPFNFDEDFKMLEPMQFLDRITGCFDVKQFICGYDYRFGRKGSGDITFLKSYCINKGIGLEVAGPVLIDGVRVSSTEIRKHIAEGNIQAAEKMLSGSYFISGKVIKGRREGHLYNIPTANIEVPQDKLTVKSGVYATETVIGERRYASVTNVGSKPTFGDYSPSVETMIDGFSGDLYGEEITVFFRKELRSIEKFANKQKLVEQIYIDTEKSRAIFNEKKLEEKNA